MNIDNYLDILFRLVKKSDKLGEIPVGSIVIYQNKVIGKGFNNRQSRKNVCGHAEINAILQAEKKIGDWRLNDCILISTLKPCNMCSEVIKSSRIDKIYYLIDQKDSNSYDNYYLVDSNNEIIKDINTIFKEYFNKLRK